MTITRSRAGTCSSTWLEASGRMAVMFSVGQAESVWPRTARCGSPWLDMAQAKEPWLGMT